MADAKRPGGLYLAEDQKSYVDADGNPVDAKDAKAALKSGKAERKAATEGEGAESEPKKGSLPADFPHRAQLEAAGITSYGKLRDAGDLTAIEGIGEARAAEIQAALEA